MEKMKTNNHKVIRNNPGSYFYGDLINRNLLCDSYGANRIFVISHLSFPIEKAPYGKLYTLNQKVAQNGYKQATGISQ